MTSAHTTDPIAQVMREALFELQKLVTQRSANQADFLVIVKTFLLGVVTTAVELVGVTIPESAPILYADLEAAMKMGGMLEIAKATNGTVNYSVSDIEPDDRVSGMNYIGQQLSVTLFKCLHELPMQLRSQEMMLRAVENLLANLLSQKFPDNAHYILDSLCEHVHMALNDLGARVRH